MAKLHPAARTCALVLAMAAIAPACRAQPSGAETVWNCWYNGDTTYRCRLAHARDEPGGKTEPYVPAPRGSLLPRRRPLPAIVRTIHEHPAQLHGRTITIPVFTEPRDPQFATMLVEAVMCGARPDCRARILRSAAAVALEYEEDPARPEWRPE
jgi:hypothetical protein